MPVTFVIGRAGSGKTTRCLHRIVEATRADPLGPAILWIVPKQATFMAERQLTCESGLDAFFRARVLSFDQLATEALDDCGGCASPQVTPLGRQMILGHLLRRLQPRLSYFKSSARQVGLAAELDATFAEMERAGKGAGDLAEVAAELEASEGVDADGGSLAAKLRDLRLVYESYNAFLGQDRVDPRRRATQVLDLLAAWPLLRGATVYVDGFLDFSDDERRALAVLAKSCAAVEITLLLDPESPVLKDPHKNPDETGLFRRTEQCYRKLWFTFSEGDVAVGEPVILREPHRFRTTALRTLHGTAFAQSHTVPQSQPPSDDDASDLRFVVAPDRVTEVEALARNIRTLLTEGYRLREIAVLVRSLEDYAALIDAAFREHGLPYFVDRRRTAAHHPLLQFVRAALQIARFDWPHAAVMTLLKGGLACLSPEEADEVEDYVLRHRIRGGTAWESAEPWSYRRDLTRAGEDDDGAGPAVPGAVRADTLRRTVHERLRPLITLARKPDNESPALREFVIAVLELLEACNVRQTLGAWMQSAADAGDFEQHDEHAQVWAELMALLGQMADLLGDERVTAAQFSEVLESGLERFDLAITPPTLDQVLVGQVDRTRTPPGLRACFVLGLNAGEFPRAARDDTVLTDAERRELRRRRVDLEGDGRQSLLDERLLGYVAFTRAAEKLVLSRPVMGDGDRAAEPSAFWQELRELFPTSEPEQVPPMRHGDLAHAWTARQLVVTLAQWVRAGGDASRAGGVAPDDGTLAAYQWLAAYPAGDDAVARARRLGLQALNYSNDASLSRGVAAELFSAPLRATAARLETFSSCAFRHFLRYGLALTEREPPGVTGLDLSNVYHHVLEALVDAAVRSGVDLADPAAPISDETIHALTEQVGKSLRGELMLGNARNEYLLGRVERTLRELVAAQREALGRGSFRPKKVGVRFGEGGGAAAPPLKLPTPAGAGVSLVGSIDRVDALPDGTFAAIDYRLGGRTLSLQEVYYGLSLQLLAGLLALRGGPESGGPRPAAAFYLQATRGISPVKHPDDAPGPTDPKYLLRVKPRGIVDGGYVTGFDKDMGDGTSAVLNVSRRKSDGEFGNRRASDVADRAEFEALLAHVAKKCGELADGILSGEVGVRPYRIGTETPCPRCAYRSVCRFDPAVDRYRNLDPLGKEDVFKKVRGDSE